MATDNCNCKADTPAAVPFSRWMALYLLTDIERQLSEVGAVALAGQTLEEHADPEGGSDTVTHLLFGVIRERVLNAALSIALRDMLESLPEEVAHG